MNRIALVYPFTNMDTVPSLCNTVEILAENGYMVEVFLKTSPEFILPSFQHSNILIHPSYPPRWKRRGIHRVIPANWSRPLDILQRHARIPYRAFIGVDPEGLSLAAHLAGLSRIPLVYYSLELMLSQEVGNGVQQKLKRAETRLSRKSAFVIIQDEARASLLARDNAVPMDRFVYVPNSPLGQARRQKSDYWHKKFGLPPRVKVVLHAGSISEWTGIMDIVDSVSDWPDDFALVVHTRSNPGASEAILALQRRAMPGRVFFSLEPVSRQDYGQLMDGADIGLAFYKLVPGNVYTQQNISTIGLSSGKVAYALHSGLPVVVSRSEGLPNLIESTRSGIVVDHFSEIGNALAVIERSHDAYSEAAMQLYNSRLNFKDGFNRVLARLDTL